MSDPRRRSGRSRGRRWRAPASAAVACALALGPSPVVAQEAPGGDAQVRELLKRAKDVYEGLTSLQAQFAQTIEIPLLGRRRDGHGIWYQKGPGRFKMDFVDPEGDVIVADGRHLWLYYPSTHPGQVIRSEIDANVTGAGMVDLQGRIFQEADNYRAELQGREDVSGHGTWRIALTPLGVSPYRQVRVWVDGESFLVRRFEIVEDNETIRTVILDGLHPDQPIDDAVFEFEPPEDADVFEG